MRLRAFAAAFGMGLVGVVAACVSDSSSPVVTGGDAAAQGAIGGACYPDHTCASGLTCLSNDTCGSDTTDGATNPPATDGSTSSSDATQSNDATSETDAMDTGVDAGCPLASPPSLGKMICPDINHQCNFANTGACCYTQASTYECSKSGLDSMGMGCVEFYFCLGKDDCGGKLCVLANATLTGSCPTGIAAVTSTEITSTCQTSAGAGDSVLCRAAADCPAPLTCATATITDLSLTVGLCQ